MLDYSTFVFFEVYKKNDLITRKLQEDEHTRIYHRPLAREDITSIFANRSCLIRLRKSISFLRMETPPLIWSMPCWIVQLILFWKN